jgi:hypothetical protein
MLAGMDLVLASLSLSLFEFIKFFLLNLLSSWNQTSSAGAVVSNEQCGLVCHFNCTGK